MGISLLRVICLVGVGMNCILGSLAAAKAFPIPKFLFLLTPSSSFPVFLTLQTSSRHAHSSLETPAKLRVLLRWA